MIKTLFIGQGRRDGSIRCFLQAEPWVALFVAQDDEGCSREEQSEREPGDRVDQVIVGKRDYREAACGNAAGVGRIIGVDIIRGGVGQISRGGYSGDVAGIPMVGGGIVRAQKAAFEFRDAQKASDDCFADNLALRTGGGCFIFRRDEAAIDEDDEAFVGLQRGYEPIAGAENGRRFYQRFFVV